MDNFFNYIKEDIAVKTELLSTLPTKTKANISKYNETIDDIEAKYKHYKENVKKYLADKSMSIKYEDKNIDSNEQIQQQETILKNYEEAGKYLNPYNTYFEKLDFDQLLHKLSHYADFDFVKLNNIIKTIYDKFSLVNIRLSGSSFNSTPYVNEYMTKFIELISTQGYDFYNIEKDFETIYWVNPNLVKHIELNFRQLIVKHAREFESYVDKQKMELMVKNAVGDYTDYLNKYKEAHQNALYAKKESVKDIIELATTGEININSYLKDSKERNKANSMLVIEDPNRNYNQDNQDLYSNIRILKNVIQEYKTYLEFTPLINYSKEKLKNFSAPKTMIELKKDIEESENAIEKLNKAVRGEAEEQGFFAKLFSKNKTSTKSPKQLLTELLVTADELLLSYQMIDTINFADTLKKVVNDNTTVEELLSVINAYDYFKFLEISEANKIEKYDELLEQVEKFTKFATNPNNMVITSIPAYQEYDVAKVIIDKYRVININLTPDILTSNNLDSLLGYIDIFLRSKQIEDSGITAEEIWFMIETKKILEAK